MDTLDSRTCSGFSRDAPNKLGIPTHRPCEIPKGQQHRQPERRVDLSPLAREQRREMIGKLHQPDQGERHGYALQGQDIKAQVRV